MRMLVADDTVWLMDDPDAIVPQAPSPSAAQDIALRQEADTAIGRSRAIGPTHRIAFPDAQNIPSVVFSPDGSTAYCLVDGQGVDLWAAGVSIWPEALGTITAMVLIAWIVVARRARSRPQMTGEPHCRRCNYHVVAQAPDSVKRGAERRRPEPGVLCPECGTDLSRVRPRRGRGTLRRLAIPTMIALMAALGYGLLWAMRAPRTGPIAQRYGVWCSWIDRVAERRQIGWLLKHRIRVYRLLRVDTRTGKTLGILRTRRDQPGTKLLVSPDGEHLAFGDDQGRLVWLSTSSGRIDASIVTGRMYDDRDSALIGMDGTTDDPRVYYAIADQSRKVSRLARWRPSTGEHYTIMEDPAFQLTYRNGGTASVVCKYGLLRWPEGTATITAPSFMEWMQKHQGTLTVRGPAEQGGEVVRTIDATSEFAGLTPLVTSPNGSSVFLSMMSSGIIGFDPRTGERLGTLRPGLTYVPSERIILSTDGRFMYVDAFPNVILVRDMVRRAWVARLELPGDMIAPELSISPDGRWLAATPFRSLTKATGSRAAAGPYVHELFLFDMAPLQSEADTGTR